MASILVVDDSMFDLKRASLLLEKHLVDTEVRSAINGQEALELIRSQPPNVVVTDLQMPEMNGLELMKHVREEFPLIPVVLMTAAGSEAIATEALMNGAANYVPKKQLAIDLAAVVSRLLGRSQDHQKRQRLFDSVTSLSLDMENDRQLQSTFVHEFRELLEQRRLFNENDTFRIATAVDEALANAYYHGNLEVSSKLREEDAVSFEKLANERLQQEPYANRRIFVEVEINDSFVITIRDEGPGFDPSKLPDPFEPGFAERPCGRGVLLMTSFMDEVTFNEKGNQVTMVKKACKEEAVEH